MRDSSCRLGGFNKLEAVSPILSSACALRRGRKWGSKELFLKANGEYYQTVSPHIWLATRHLVPLVAGTVQSVCLNESQQIIRDNHPNPGDAQLNPDGLFIHQSDAAYDARMSVNKQCHIVTIPWLAVSLNCVVVFENVSRRV